MDTRDGSLLTEADADRAVLEDARIAVIGADALGRSLAANLRDSGLAVALAAVDSHHRSTAVDEGWQVGEPSEIVRRADVVVIAAPDARVPRLVSETIGPDVPNGASVCFLSGHPLAFAELALPDTVDQIMLAPRMVAEGVRRTYLDGTGYVAYVGVEHDAWGDAWERLLALASAAGALRRGALRMSAQQEAMLDRYVALTAGPRIAAAVETAFGVGVEAGLPAEALVLELYMSGELEETFGAFREVGFRAVTDRGGLVSRDVSEDAADLDATVARRFRDVLEELRAGKVPEPGPRPTRGHPGTDPLTIAENRVRSALRRRT